MADGSRFSYQVALLAADARGDEVHHPRDLHAHGHLRRARRVPARLGGQLTGQEVAQRQIS
ncbi:MAG: hypothetical protein ACE5H2_08990 [Terriglobia bacterium]